MVSMLSPVEDQMRALFPPETHPNQLLEAAVEALLTPTSAVLDIGCGRTAPNLAKLKGRAGKLTGIDVIPFTIDDPDMTLLTRDVGAMEGIADGSIDIAYSRAVMEHLTDPDAAYREIARVLKPGGRYLFITPSIFDYGSIIAALVPNKFHGKIVNLTEGRAEEDVFPTVYATNRIGLIRRQAAAAGLKVHDARYVGQYPNYFVFNRALFWLGSMYQKTIERFSLTQPLQGWIFCVLER